MVAYVAAMIASLATKLSLSKQEEPVDLGDLWCPTKELVTRGSTSSVKSTSQGRGRLILFGVSCAPWGDF